VRYAEIAGILTGRAGATAEDGVDWVRDLVEEFGILALRQYGIEARHFGELVEKAARSGSMKGNPIVLTREELGAVLAASA
jgi:alcohol dehydrogenase class IV